jgi:hypothetical protein
MSTATLATCRRINTKAKSFLEPKLALLRDYERFRFVVHVHAVNIFGL